MLKKTSILIIIVTLVIGSWAIYRNYKNHQEEKLRSVKFDVKYSTDSVIVTDTGLVKRLLLKKGTYFGTYLSDGDLALTPPRPKNYLTEINKYFNLYSLPAWYIHIEYAGKGKYDFRATDKIADFAVKNGAKMQAHNMVWNIWIPEWITKGNYSSEELGEILKNHIQTVVRHYRDKYPGSVIAWDIVNESMSDSEELDPKKAHLNGLKKDLPIWNKIHKPGSTDPTDYIQLAFQWAHEADPNVKLYWNEYNVEYKGFKMDRWFKLVKQLRAKGVPIHGVGFQTHIPVTYNHSFDELRENMDRFAAIGVESQVTEMDVLMSKTSFTHPPYRPSYMNSEYVNSPTVADFKRQAELYRGVIDACIAAKNCKALILFGAWDPVSYANFDFKDKEGRVLRPFYPNILDDNMRPKLAFKALMEEVKARIK